MSVLVPASLQGPGASQLPHPLEMTPSVKMGRRLRSGSGCTGEKAESQENRGWAEVMKQMGWEHIVVFKKSLLSSSACFPWAEGLEWNGG